MRKLGLKKNDLVKISGQYYRKQVCVTRKKFLFPWSDESLFPNSCDLPMKILLTYQQQSAVDRVLDLQLKTAKWALRAFRSCMVEQSQRLNELIKYSSSPVSLLDLYSQ